MERGKRVWLIWSSKVRIRERTSAEPSGVEETAQRVWVNREGWLVWGQHLGSGSMRADGECGRKHHLSVPQRDGLESGGAERGAERGVQSSVCESCSLGVC